MKKTMIAFMVVVMTSAAVWGAETRQPATGDLARDFKNPPESTKPRCYWYWIDGNISRAGITHDLEAMKRVGIGEGYIGIIGGGEIKALTEPWWQLIEHAVREGGRLGVDVGLFNCPGWSQSGGPWIKPEQAMRYVATLEMRIPGSKHFEGKLPQPKGDFQDLAVLAFPAPAHDSDDAAARGGKITREPKAVAFEFPEPFEARSLVVHPSKEVNTSGEFQVSDDGLQYRTLRKFDIDRHNLSVNVGPVPLAPIAISFPAVTSKHFRLALKEACELGDVILSSAARLESYPEKQLAKLFQEPHPPFDFYTWRTQAEPESKDLVIPSDSVRDISRQVGKDGTLSWDPPAGEWIVLRTVLMPTGTENSPSPPEATGLEVDKMSRAALGHHFESYVGKLLARIPENERRAWKHVVADSYEMGSQNWTDGMAGDFKERYGYDPMPLLPVLTGRIVGSATQSDRFLWDLRRMVADRISRDYVGGLRDLCHKNGLKMWLENYGHWGFPGEFLQYGGNCDEISGEFWESGGLGTLELRAASSAAHIYGKRQVFAEAFTGGPAFISTPWSLKKRGDWALCQGINQFVLHVYIHQPWEDRRPGVNAGFGTEFNRHNTWFEASGSWIGYLRRCSVLLQQGLPVADVAYFIGEDTPKAFGISNPEVPGYDFDYINAEVLLNRAIAKEGRLVLPDGMSYKLLVLLPQDTMRPEVLEKIATLAKAGVAVYGTRRPMRSPSLRNFPACDQQVEKLAVELWDKGLVVRDGALRDVLNRIKTPPDLDGKDMQKILFSHRRTADADFYFLSNQTDEALDLAPAFRVTGRDPELWHPDTGAIERLAVYEVGETSTRVPVRLAARASVFVVFRGKAETDNIIAVKHNGEPLLGKWAPEEFLRADGGRILVQTRRPGRYELTTADGKTKAFTVPDPPAPTAIAGPWEVMFPGVALPAPFAKLASWTEHADAAIKYFSGTAVYRTTFDAPAVKRRERTILDLGGVESLAEVTLNGRKFGALWKPPFRLDVTGAIKPGANVLEVSVVNTWYNRLLGQRKEPAAFSAPDVFKPWVLKEVNTDDPLGTSGLLGPVQLLTIQTVEVE
jgi:hypothetical protein